MEGRDTETNWNPHEKTNSTGNGIMYKIIKYRIIISLSYWLIDISQFHKTICI